MSSSAITDFVPSSCSQVFVSFDGTNWTDVSGESQSVSGTEQSRMSGEVYVFAGDKALVTSGSREPMELTFAFVYSEDDAEEYGLVRANWEDTSGCGSLIWARWSPRGGSAGHELLEAAGYMTSFLYPEVDASSGDPIMSGFGMITAEITTTIVAS